MTRQGALDRIEALLAGVTTPRAVVVMMAEPLSIPVSPLYACWYAGETEEGFSTFGDYNPTEELVIGAYWKVEASNQTRESLEAEIWGASRAIQAAIRGDSNLSTHVTEARFGYARVGWTKIGEVSYRSLRIPLYLRMYEQDTITP